MCIVEKYNTNILLLTNYKKLIDTTEFLCYTQIVKNKKEVNMIVDSPIIILKDKDVLTLSEHMQKGASERARLSMKRALENGLSSHSLEVAVEENDLGYAEFCLQHFVSIDMKSSEPYLGKNMNLFAKCIQLGNPKMIDLFLKYGIDVNGSKRKQSFGKPLLTGIEVNNPELVQKLIERGAETDILIGEENDFRYPNPSKTFVQFNTTPIYKALETYYARQDFDTRVIDILVNKEPSCIINGGHILQKFYACGYERTSILETRSCLWLIVHNNDLEMAERFFGEKADIERQKAGLSLSETALYQQLPFDEPLMGINALSPFAEALKNENLDMIRFLINREQRVGTLQNLYEMKALGLAVCQKTHNRDIEQFLQALPQIPQKSDNLSIRFLQYKAPTENLFEIPQNQGIKAKTTKQPIVVARKKIPHAVGLCLFSRDRINGKE